MHILNLRVLTLSVLSFPEGAGREKVQTDVPAGRGQGAEGQHRPSRRVRVDHAVPLPVRGRVLGLRPLHRDESQAVDRRARDRGQNSAGRGAAVRAQRDTRRLLTNFTARFLFFIILIVQFENRKRRIPYTWGRREEIIIQCVCVMYKTDAVSRAR